MLGRPPAQLVERGPESLTARGEAVRHTDRGSGWNAAFYQAGTHQLIQATGQHALADPWDLAADLGKTGGTSEQRPDNQAAPALAEQAEHGRESLTAHFVVLVARQVQTVPVAAFVPITTLGR